MDDFVTKITKNIVTFETRNQIIFIRRSLLQDSFFSLESENYGCWLTITTKGPTYSFFIPKTIEELTGTIRGLVSDLS